MNIGRIPLPVFFLMLSATLSAADFSSTPVVEQNPNPAVPLAAIVRFSVDTPVETTITISDGERKWDVRFESSRNPIEGLPLVGFRPGRKHEIRIQIRDRAGKVTSAPQPLQFTAPPLPEGGSDFPPVQVRVSDPKQMEPGWTLLSVRRQGRGPAAGGAQARGGGGRGAGPGEPVFATGYGLILALDEQGQVVWYYRGSNRTADVHRLRNGNIAFITNDQRLLEVDLLGNIKGEWCASRRPQGACTGVPVDALTMHHSFTELPNGNFLMVSGELREIDDYYTSESDPQAPRKRQKVMGDQMALKIQQALLPEAEGRR